MTFFELTGWPVFIAVSVVAVLLVVVTVGVLPRHRRPGAGKYVLQFVAVVLVLVFALAGIFLKMNMDNQWYSSWGDLFSDGGGAVTTESVGALPMAAKAVEELPHRPFTAAQSAPAKNTFFGSQLDPANTSGQWVSFKLPGAESGTTQDATAWLPPSYMSQPHRAYP
ncbi:hypothetical protein [Kocuria tytonis]|uniref:hypothetical protein n=1 Tax=Kocuria tytonis TaxID=2054280 RepID=UPI001F481FDD|nr:hypothetical protein [Kocuria tytonis]